MERTKKRLEAYASKMRDIDNYTHDDKQRINNPPVGIASHDKSEEKVKTYSYDPHIDPSLQWAGKKEGDDFSVITSSIHVHESIKPLSIIAKVTKEYCDTEKGQIKGQMSLFDDVTPAARLKKKREAIEFYQHGVNWTNRMIAGDSLIIMNSLLEKEGMAGQVQMVYFDPPYGISYGSNFQPFVNDRTVSDKKDDDLSQEPETIKAFRDTWELGIHSYLSYIRSRVVLAKELLSETGSIFVQIGIDNVHLVRNILDEIFGAENFISMITFQKTGFKPSNRIQNVADYILWYGKKKEKCKFHKLFLPKTLGELSNPSNRYDQLELPDGTRRALTKEEKKNPMLIPEGGRPYQLVDVTSQGGNSNTPKEPYEFQGKVHYCPPNRSWNIETLKIIEKMGRLVSTGKRLMYVKYLDEFPVYELTNVWDDCAITPDMVYVVQTNPNVIQRCLLMTTDPGDLVLDITCGSGTTAFVAEQWGRRWITCDTSRVAISLAKQRLLTSVFDYYKLLNEDEGVSSGYVYKTVPHVALSDIAAGNTDLREILYDKPEIDTNRIRVSGPFTVEALPAPVVKAIDSLEEFEMEDLTIKQNDWREQLLATGIMGRGGNRLEFSRVEPLTGTKFLQAEAETKEETPRRAVICFAGETKPLDSRMVAMALDEAENLRPTPQLIIFAAFQFGPEASKDIDDMNWPGVTLLKAQMNTDLMTSDLKKKQSSDQSFWLIGQPDVEIIKDGRTKNKYKVRVNGFDYYDVKKGSIESGNSSRIAMWMLDQDYDGLCIEPDQVFFPMGGKKDGWNKLAKTLKAEIDEDLIEKYEGNESLWFMVQPNSQIAIKIVDDRGIESMKVIRIGDE